MDGPADKYIPAFPKPDPGPSLEYVRKHGKIILYGPDNIATVETIYGMVVYFHACRLNDDGTIREFMRNTVNKYVRCKLEKNDDADESTFTIHKTDSGGTVPPV
jgi:hypothetical protein